MTTVATTSIGVSPGTVKSAPSGPTVVSEVRLNKAGRLTGNTAAGDSDWVPLSSHRTAKVLFSPIGAASVEIWAVAKLVFGTDGEPDLGASTMVRITTVAVDPTYGAIYDLGEVSYPYLRMTGTAAFEAVVWGSK